MSSGKNDDALSPRDDRYDDLVSLLASAVQHAIELNASASGAIQQLSESAAKFGQSVSTADRSLQQLSESIPKSTFSAVATSFAAAANTAAATITSHLSNANKVATEAATTYSQAAADARTSVELEIARVHVAWRNYFASGVILGLISGSILTSAVLWLFR
jgi:hypothetical protein